MRQISSVQRHEFTTHIQDGLLTPDFKGGSSDGSVALRAWDERVGPAVDGFEPEFLLISAGFDARVDDPIGGLCWDDETFAEMTRRCVVLAERWCGGRIVSLLEGGYNPGGLASAAVAHVSSLA